jgi:hypothetical protein
MSRADGSAGSTVAAHRLSGAAPCLGALFRIRRGANLRERSLAARASLIEDVANPAEAEPPSVTTTALRRAIVDRLEKVDRYNPIFGHCCEGEPESTVDDQQLPPRDLGCCECTVGWGGWDVVNLGAAPVSREAKFGDLTAEILYHV